MYDYKPQYAKGLKSMAVALSDAPTKQTTRDIIVAIIRTTVGLADMYNIDIQNYLKPGTQMQLPIKKGQ